jgi:hypothetical protein
MDQLRVIIDTHGNVRHLYDDQHEGMYAVFGPVEHVYRNSHVEPTSALSQQAKQIIWDAYKGEVGKTLSKTTKLVFPANRWWADMTILGPIGPVLGPYDTRREALEAEVKWLIDHHLPVPIQEELTIRANGTAG